MESLSDHKYIILELREKNRNTVMGNKKGGFPRWNVKGINKDMFVALVIAGGMMRGTGEETIERKERRVNRLMIDAYNNSMKRVGKPINRAAMYWWNSEIAEIRRRCITWRRRLVRAKRRKSPEYVAQVVDTLKENRKQLRRHIGKAKREAWDELLTSQISS